MPYARRIACVTSSNGAPALIGSPATGPDLRAPLDLGDELVPEPRFSQARGGLQENGARRVLLEALLEERLELRELAVATDARRGLAEQGAQGDAGVARAPEHVQLPVVFDGEALLEQRRRDAVDDERRPAARARVRARRSRAQRGDAVEQIADRHAAMEHRASGAEHGEHARHHVGNRERAARGARGLLRARAAEGDQDRAVGERLRHDVEHGGGRAHGVRERRERRGRLGVAPVERGRRADVEQEHAEHALLERRERRRGRGRWTLVVLARDPRALEQRRDLGPIARALGWILREERRDRALDVLGHVGANAAHGQGLFEEDLREHRDDAPARERRALRQRLVEEAPEREHVGPRVDVARAARLLGRHVARRADEHPGLRQIAPQALARDAEVEHARLVEVAAGGEHHVRRLHVAVHDPARVRVTERGGDPRAERERVVHAEALALQARREALALEPFHREERPVLPFAVRNVTNDVRVVEVREHLGLAHEARPLVDRAEQLQRDEPARSAIARAVHRRHPAGARVRKDLEAIGDGAWTHPIQPISNERSRRWTASGRVS